MTYKKNLTQNRLCRFSDIAAYALCKFSAADWASGDAVLSPRKPLAKWPAAWANAPLKNQFPLMTYKKNLTQNRLCRFSDIAAYALCKFSAADGEPGDAVWSPRRPLAKWPAAWANAPSKKQFPLMTYEKNLTQNRLCRSTDIAAYAFCQFSAAVATFGAAAWLPRRPLAKWPAAWANAPFK